jgi:transcriptional regulator with XRE-family HTH domain
MYETLGTALRQLRHAKDLTLEEVAEATGISIAMLSRAERDQRSPSPTIVGILASFYGVSPAALDRLSAEERLRTREQGRASSSRDMQFMHPEAHSMRRRQPRPSDVDESPWPPARMPVVGSVAPPADYSLSPAYPESTFDASGDREALTDAARVAEAALETTLRAARRAMASGDPEQIEAALSVVERLRAVLRDG